VAQGKVGASIVVGFTCKCLPFLDTHREHGYTEAMISWSMLAPQMRSINGALNPLLLVALAPPRAAMQRLRSVNREHRVHGVAHISIIEARGHVPRGRPVLRVLLTFTR